MWSCEGISERFVGESGTGSALPHSFWPLGTLRPNLTLVAESCLRFDEMKLSWLFSAKRDNIRRLVGRDRELNLSNKYALST